MNSDLYDIETLSRPPHDGDMSRTLTEINNTVKHAMNLHKTCQEEMAQLREQLQQAEAACAEMREAVAWLAANTNVCYPQKQWGIVTRALSTDCGKGVLEKIQKLRGALQLIADGRWNVGKINDVDAITFAKLQLKALKETQ